MINVTWSQFITERRKFKGLTRRKLAEMANIDPSYVTLIERDGYIPRKNKVLSIAKALELPETEALLRAGFAPESLHAEQIIEAVSETKAFRQLDTNLRECIKSIVELSSEQQHKVAELLFSYVKTLKAQERDLPVSRSLRRSRGGSAPL